MNIKKAPKRKGADRLKPFYKPNLCRRISAIDEAGKTRILISNRIKFAIGIIG